MLNRPDSESMPGGDTVQMRETRAALQALGVEVSVSHELDADTRCYDLAHIFNLQRAHETYAQFSACRRRGTPAVLSSIYYDRPTWRLELQTSPRWRRLRSFLPYWPVAVASRAWWALFTPLRPEWRLQRSVLDQANALLPNSVSEGRFLERRFRICGRDRIHVIPNAASVERFDPNRPHVARLPAQLPSREFVLQVGRIEPVKNQLALIRALFDVDVPIVFAGPQPPWAADYAAQCIRLAKRRGNVQFLGAVPHDTLPSLYAAARVHALPSLRETPGLVSLEAALMRCNIVTTDQGPTAEYFGSWAWYCSPYDLRSIRRAVLAARSAPFPEPLRQRILENYTWPAAAQKTLAAYQWALGRRRHD
jgi:glycosyltransferase involved in cell wall biosynthesis